MRRYLLVLVAACVFAAVVFPPAASATTWVVKNRAGTKIGTVVTGSARKASVYSRTGTRWGEVRWNSAVPAYMAYMWLAGDTGVRKEASVRKRWFGAGGTGVWGWYVKSDTSSSSWVAGKKNGRWLVYGFENASSGSWGSVSGACPGWAAGGAVYILNSRMK